MDTLEIYLTFILLLLLNVDGNSVSVHEILYTETDQDSSAMDVSMTEMTDISYGGKTELSQIQPQDYEYQEFNNSSNLSMPELDCEKEHYNQEEFKILPNGSVLLYDYILENSSYELKGDKLSICASGSNEEDIILAYIVQIGSLISLIALSLHLLAFVCITTLRNFPGYNLASMSVGLFMAYLLLLIGQSPQVVGTSCVVSAAFQHYFFLSSFLWMTVISFDIWRALWHATKTLTAKSNRVMSKKFLFYSLFAWCLSLMVSIVAVIMDNSDDIPEKYKPAFGRFDFCFFNNELARNIFFGIPSLIMFIVNTGFFIHSIYMIVDNRMKKKNKEYSIAMRNFVLYARLGVIMGATWLFGYLSATLDLTKLSYVFDSLNSLQGLFVFFLFTCTKKVWVSIRAIFTKTKSANNSFKLTSVTTKCESN